MTKIINIKSGEKYDIYCGRAGHGQDGYFGNPHIIGYCNQMQCNCVHNREESIEAYRKDFDYRIKYDAQFFLRILELKDKILGCFCKPLPCHCDVIKEYLDNLSDKVKNLNKVIIAGSRNINNYKVVEHMINETIKQNNLIINEIVCGKAKGVDSCGEKYGINNNIPIKEFPAQWDKFGKSAGYKRNEEMAKYATHLILIWDGLSKGSKHMLDLAKKYNLKIFEWIFQ